MEIILTQNQGNQISIACDGQPSHTFTLASLLPQEDGVLTDPVKTGKGLFDALFAAGSPARAAWDAHPKRILLVTEDTALDAIPWEYLYGPNGFIVLDCAFVRGLPASRRQPAPDLTGIPLHIVAIPSNPIDHEITRLDIVGEWARLKDSIRDLKTAIRLERVRPPTLEQIRRLVANQRQRLVHFMGHGGHNGRASFLFFENEHGGPKPVTAQDFIRRMEESAFLVTLNACVSATPGTTKFSNLARALTERGVPYALGMRFSIPDSDAKAFSQTFYSELARGSSVEDALRHARNSLAESKNPWAVGTPVLYTSLSETAKGFETPPGTPRMDEHQPPMEVSDLPRAEGAFQGRIDELLALGKALTGEPRAKLLTIHGVGGQGKTALAREAVERFAHAWPDGVWAISLETMPSRAAFCFQLAQFLNIPTDGFAQAADLERAVLAQIENLSILIMLDNAETFVQAVRANDADAFELSAFLKENLRGTAAGLLVTSREPLGWPGELSLPLEGLDEAEGVALFTQSAPQRQNDIQVAQAAALSKQLDGHPLALRLLGLTFNESATSLEAFLAEHQTRLLHAEDKYKTVEHRHRTLYASIETSTRHLSEAERALLSGLWIFQAPFLPETAAEIFTAPDLIEAERKARQEQIVEQLHTLHRRGLLLREQETLASGNIVLYHNLPIVHLFAKEYLEQALPMATLQAQMGMAYSALLQNIDRQINRSSWASYLAVRCREDFEACIDWAESSEQGWYLNRLGHVLQRIGDRQAGLSWLKRALEMAQGTDQNLQLHIINNMANVYETTGQPGQALALYEQALPLMREVGERAGEATTLSNMASVYSDTGQPMQALALYEQALPIQREVGDREDEATTLNNMANVYQTTGQPGQALVLYEQALPIWRKVGNRAGEATTLNNMGMVYSDMGQPMQALALYEQAIPIQCEVGDRAGEAATLNNMAFVYSDTGQPMQALALYEQALPIQREVGNRAGEAATLSNMGLVYNNTGQLGQALALYEQSLPIARDVGDRVGEAKTLNSMATVYKATGHPGQALALCEQALPLMREVGDRAGEATTLNNMGMIYRDMGQQVQALALFEQALPIQREVGNRAGEATTLNNMGMMYRDMGQQVQALALFEQALPIRRDVGDRTGEATTLNNMASLYSDTGQPEKALALFEQVLPLMREVDNRAGEATILNNMGMVYQAMGHLGQALALFEQVLPLMREVDNRAGEAMTCFNMAMLVRDMGQAQWALELLRQAVILERQVQHPDYDDDVAILAQWEAAFARDDPSLDSSSPKSGGLSPQDIDAIVASTLAVMMDLPEKRSEWHKIIKEELQKAQSSKFQTETEFFTSILALLDGETLTLSVTNPYSKAIQDIVKKLSGSNALPK